MSTCNDRKTEAKTEYVDSYSLTKYTLEESCLPNAEIVPKDYLLYHNSSVSIMIASDSCKTWIKYEMFDIF